MMKSQVTFTWILICIYLISTSGSHGTKNYQKHFEKPLNVSWKIRDLDILVEIVPSPKWPNVTSVEYEVYTKYPGDERWRKRPCEAETTDSANSTVPYFCHLDFTLYDDKLKVMVRAKWKQVIRNGSTTTRYSRMRKADVLVDVISQGEFTAPDLYGVVPNGRNNITFDITIPTTEVACWLRNFTYQFVVVDITEEEHYDCSGNLPVINASRNDPMIRRFPKIKRDSHLTECDESYTQAIYLDGLQLGSKYCLEANYETFYEDRNLTIKSEFAHYVFDLMPTAEPMSRIWLVPLTLFVYTIAVILYYIHWKRKKQRKMYNIQEEYYEDQRTLLIRDNMYSSVKRFDPTNGEPEADVIERVTDEEQGMACELELRKAESENYGMRLGDKDEKKSEMNPVNVEENTRKEEVSATMKEDDHPVSKHSLIDSGMESYDDESRKSSLCSSASSSSQQQHITTGGYVQKDSFHQQRGKDSGGGASVETNSFTNTHYVDRQLMY